MTTELHLSPEDRAALADEIAERVLAMRIQPVWTTEQAMKIVGKKTPATFRFWVTKYAPRANCGNGRWNREKIVHGLNKEATVGGSKCKTGDHLRKRKAIK